MINEQIRALQEEIDEATKRRLKLATEARSILEDENSTDEQRSTADKNTEEVRKLNDEIKEKNKKIEDLRSLLDVPKPEKGKPEGRKLKTDDKTELRKAEVAYLMADKQAFRADDTLTGLVSPDVGVTIPEDISYQPQDTPNTVTDLKKLVNVFPAKTASGKYPVADKVTGTLHTAEELQKNPELAKPTFTEVDWKVDTYRGALAFSQESIDDSVIDVVDFVGKQAVEKKVNTTNVAISTALKSFTAKTVSGESVDDIKHIINVDLDKAYKRDLVVTQSFYNYLDTLKDKNGQYLLKPAITDGSPERLLGLNVYVIEDNLLGEVGEAHAWVGDLKRAILFADRKELQVRWADNDYFSQDLAEIVRFGVSVADKAAGYFLTYTDATSTATDPKS